MMSVVATLVLAASTTTTIANVHRGAVLPAARVVVLAVPALALVLYWFLVVRAKKQGG